ncbi:MAG: ATPase [Lachnospiraceae bacterium]|jgi:hypothetical protein|nr:ATPase [Lachnospiraceae bacterium]MCI8996820.1 ATPase [Lachnospiraceae bacterium]MCI9135161.1 ATPase [Lachnospiraceae bacterium]
MEYMDTVIARLSEIESAAVRISEDAAQQKKALAKEYEEKTKAFDEEIDAQTDEKLEKLREELQEKADRELKKMHQATQKILEGLDQEYERDHEKISQQLLDKMIRE